jgi:hypothetical protein
VPSPDSAFPDLECARCFIRREDKAELTIAATTHDIQVSA